MFSVLFVTMLEMGVLTQCSRRESKAGSISRITDARTVPFFMRKFQVRGVLSPVAQMAMAKFFVLCTKKAMHDTIAPCLARHWKRSAT